MTLLYVIAVLALGMIGYLACDFYNEQLRERMIPLRAEIKRALRRVRR